jgi:hypothetical protein
MQLLNATCKIVLPLFLKLSLIIFNEIFVHLLEFYLVIHEVRIL